MVLDKAKKRILTVFVIALLIFIAVFIAQGNFEFLGYVVVVLLLMWALLASSKYVNYPNLVLWGLLVWGILHMIGGVLMTNGRVVYTWLIFPIVGEPYSILKYDQIVHAFGFFVATMVMYYVLEKHLKRPYGQTAIVIVVVMAGMGLGVFNEIIEFLMTVFLPNTNVGGYENTAIDLVSNFVGALAAGAYLRFKGK